MKEFSLSRRLIELQILFITWKEHGNQIEHQIRIADNKIQSKFMGWIYLDFSHYSLTSLYFTYAMSKEFCIFSGSYIEIWTQLETLPWQHKGLLWKQHKIEQIQGKLEYRNTQSVQTTV